MRAPGRRLAKLAATASVEGYGLILIGFPLIGLALGSLSSLAATESLTATRAAKMTCSARRWGAQGLRSAT
jgi:hypothetical protein